MTQHNAGTYYVATSLGNTEQATYFIEYVKHTIDWACTYPWPLLHGSLEGKPDEWQQAAIREVNGVTRADVLVILQPAGRGSHVELGVALATGKPVIIVGDDDDAPYPCIFHHHTMVTRVPDIPCAVDAMRAAVP